MLKRSESYLNTTAIRNFLLAMGVMVFALSMYRSGNHFFWDLNVYSTAINDFLSGGFLYPDLDGLKFVYPPYVLVFFSIFGKNLSLFLLIFYGVALLFSLAGKLSRELLLFSVASAGLFVNEFAMQSILTGNVTIFLHFVVIGAASYKTKRQLVYFLLAVCMTALIKPYFLAYFILGFVIWRDDKKSFFLHASIAGIIFLIIFFSQVVFTPNLFNGFLGSLQSQAIGESDGPGRDVGFAPYFLFGHFCERHIALLLHMGSVVFLSFLFLYINKRLIVCVNQEDSRKILFFAALILITLFNPRMKVYDYWIISASSLAIPFVLAKYAHQVKFHLSLIIVFLIGLLLFVLQYMFYIPSVDVIRVYFPLFYCFIVVLFFTCLNLDVPSKNRVPPGKNSGAQN